MLVVLLSTFAYAQNIQGTYWRYYSKKVGKDGPFGVLTIHQDKSDTVFCIEVGGGAPAYNSGLMYKRLTYNKVTQSYQYLPVDRILDCGLDITVNKNHLIVRTLYGSCGFGGFLYADGKYILKNEHDPIWFIDRAGRKVIFNETAPEKYVEQ